jgi:branched-chain amino acid aminotransferase
VLLGEYHAIIWLPLYNWNMSFILAYELAANGEKALDIEAASSDELTRHLPTGFYTTFRTLAGGTKVLGLRAHLDRLYGPAAAQGIQPAVPREELKRTLARLVKHNTPGESRVRLILSTSDSPGAVYAILEPFHPLAASIYQNGVRVVSLPLERATPRLKSTSFIERSQPARQLVQGETFEVLLMRNKRILEGMTSNFFYVKDGKLGTARKGILLGVTRRTVLRVARGSGLDILYRALKREQVLALDEAFITSSSRGIVPIVQIDDVTVGEGRPGAMTKQLSALYNEYVMRHAELI